MSFRSDYLNIHEKAYQRLRQEGKASWSEVTDFTERAEFFANTLRMQIPDQSKVMVLGCGDGETSLYLAQQGYEVLGADVSPSAIKWAEEKATTRKILVEFRQMNIVECLGEESYMAIIDDHCLHCIVGQDREQALRNIFSRLQSGGIFIVRTQCGDPPASVGPDFLKMWDKETRCQTHNGIAGRYFGLSENILKEIEAAGFCLKAQQVFHYPNEWEMLEVIALKK